MYNLTRKVHLFTALVIVQFILFYAVSGYVTEFPNRWLMGVGPHATRTQPFDAAHIKGSPDSPEYIAYVKEIGDLHGKIAQVRLDKNTGACDYLFVGAQGFDSATLPKDGDHLAITTNHVDFYGMLNRMHHLHGFDGGGIYQIWGVMFDLVCVAMILFSISGIYLWYKNTKRRALGWTVLALGISYTAATAIYCLCAR